MVVIGNGPGQRPKEALTLMSNGSLDVYPENSLTRFTNVVRRPIEAPRGGAETLAVRLRSIFFHNKLKSRFAKSAKMGTMEIRLAQLESQVVNGGKQPLLASIDMNRARADPYFTSGDYAHISFPKSPLLRLSTSEVAHLSVALTRPGGRINYPLEDGPPTIVELEVSMGSEAEFTMTCMSHPHAENADATSTFTATNTAAEFKTDLRRSINLAGWEMALDSVSFPRIPGSNRMLKITLAFVDSPGDELRLIHNDEKFEFERPIEEFDTTQEVMRALAARMEQIDLFYDGPNKLAKVRPVKGDKLRWGLWNMNKESYLKVRMEAFMAEACGWDFGVREFAVEKAYVLSVEEQEASAAPKPTLITHMGNLTGPKWLAEENVSLVPPDVCLAYCDRVQPTMIGDTRANLLSIVPMKRERRGTSDHIAYEPRHLTYRDVQDGDFGDIGFSFRRGDGQLARFPQTVANQYANEGATIVVLRFRPKNMAKMRRHLLQSVTRDKQSSSDDGQLFRSIKETFADKKYFPHGPEGFA
jgi:hypothetical protein